MGIVSNEHKPTKMINLSENQNSKLIPLESALDYIMGGNSLFTAAWKGTRFTFKILERANENAEGTYFRVSVLNGPDNVSNYRPIADIRDVNGMPKIELIKKTVHYVESFEFIKKIYYSLLFTDFKSIDGCEIWHNGRCSRCGRLLTVPESIAKGIGPECENRVNLFVEQYVNI